MTVQKATSIMVALVIAGIAILAGSFYVQSDTYTATVLKGPFLDVDEGKTSKFISVAPKAEGWIRGIYNGTLKLKVTDSHVPYFAWATNGDRFEGLKEGQEICLSETGYRSEYWSHYPTAVSYKDGACK